MDYTLFDKYLGEQLYEARINNQQKLSQLDMACMITGYLMKEKGKKKGISQQAYAYYEAGKRSMPSSVYHYACIILGLDEIEVFHKANDKFMKEVKI